MSNAEPEHRPTTAALVPQVVAGGQTLVRPIAAEAEIVAAFNQYQHLCTVLLVDSDYQSFSGGKSFRKKSAWRKLAVAMGVSCEIIDRQYEREGGRIIRAEIVVRATAPNGRSWDGLGACDLFEKCCVQPCSKRSWNNHTCCTADCTGARHFSNPQHDLPATAATRATNRACADLFGFGEVSAEEIVDRGDGAEQHASAATEWESIGWRSKRDHDAARTALVDVLRSLPEETQRRFRAWRESQDPVLDLSQPLAAERMESAKKLADLLAAGKVLIDDEGTVTMPDEQPPADGDDKPDAETAAETPQDESGTDDAPPAESAGDAESEPNPADPESSTPAEQPPASDGDDEEACPVCLGGPPQRIDPDCWGCDGTGTVPGHLAASAEALAAVKQQPAPKPACALCGSERTKLVRVGDVDRCENGTDCKRRAAARTGA